MIALIRPVLFSFIASKKVKRLIVDLLKDLAKRTDNKLDDEMVKVIRQALL